MKMHLKKMYLNIEGVSKSFDDTQILKSISLSLNKGEIVVLFGPNGCGKTTLLNIIAGIIPADNGKVMIAEEKNSKKNVGYVFQNYRDSLMAWRKNADNIAFPLELNHIDRKKRLCKVKKLVKELKLDIPLSNFPYQSSGGEQQLVAILREVISNAKLILLDEPFSSLDNENKAYLRIKIQEILKKLNLTGLFVSHDISEAIQLADRIIILGNNPTMILQEIKIKFKRPRKENLVYTKKFQSLKNMISARYTNENQQHKN